jgi:hypothetical protein
VQITLISPQHNYNDKQNYLYITIIFLRLKKIKIKTIIFINLKIFFLLVVRGNKILHFLDHLPI